jgi:hypothetical protein
LPLLTEPQATRIAQSAAHKIKRIRWIIFCARLSGGWLYMRVSRRGFRALFIVVMKDAACEGVKLCAMDAAASTGRMNCIGTVRGGLYGAILKRHKAVATSRQSTAVERARAFRYQPQIPHFVRDENDESCGMK